MLQEKIAAIGKRAIKSGLSTFDEDWSCFGGEETENTVYYILGGASAIAGITLGATGSIKEACTNFVKIAVTEAVLMCASQFAFGAAKGLVEEVKDIRKEKKYEKEGVITVDPE
jgi:hypothetical protein